MMLQKPPTIKGWKWEQALNHKNIVIWICDHSNLIYWFVQEFSKGMGNSSTLQETLDDAKSWIDDQLSDLRPGFSQLEDWTFDGLAEATDGCLVEPDGFCEHGCSSWMLIEGLV